MGRFRFVPPTAVPQHGGQPLPILGREFAKFGGMIRLAASLKINQDFFSTDISSGFFPGDQPPAADLTIATMPCRTASGRPGHAATTAINSGSVGAAGAPPVQESPESAPDSAPP